MWWTSFGLAVSASQFSVVTRTPCSAPRRPSAFRAFDGKRQRLRRRLLLAGDDARGPAPSAAAASIHLPIQSRSRSLLARMGDVAVVDQQRRKRHAGVGKRGAHFAEVGRVAAFKVEMADLQVLDAAARGRLGKLHQRQLPGPHFGSACPATSFPGAFGWKMPSARCTLQLETAIVGANSAGIWGTPGGGTLLAEARPRENRGGRRWTRQLWNIGVKVPDVGAEIAFYLSLGGRLMLHETLATPEGEAEYAIVLFGGTRLFLTPKPIFEDRLEAPPQNGLTHAVFEVGDLDARGRAA